MGKNWTTESEPGWYSDPQGKADHQAYWDGQTWTGKTRKGAPIRSFASGFARFLLALLIGTVVSVVTYGLLSLGVGTSNDPDVALGLAGMSVLAWFGGTFLAYRLLSK